MAGFDISDLLDDFLIESGELIEGLSDQLIELEKQPDDPELLNAVFRAFHTVKGGAGFMELTPMVDLCHRSEEVFNALRNNEITLDASLMDTTFEALDVLSAMMDALNAGNDLEPPAPELLQKLEQAAAGGAQATPATTSQPPAEAAPTSPEANAPTQPEKPVGRDPTDDEFDAFLATAAPGVVATEKADDDKIDDDEFEALLDELHGTGQSPGVEKKAQSRDDGTIDDDEFEHLLDELHGSGHAPGQAQAGANAATSKDTIDDAEFEQLLDTLHGSGHAPGTASVPAKQETTQPPASQTAEKKPAKPTKRAANGKKSSAKRSDPTIRVDTRRLDKLINLAGELVLARNRLLRLRSQGGDDAVDKAIVALDLITNDMQSAVMSMRMQTVRKLFSRFSKLVRDASRSLGKKIELELVGEDTELDKSLVDALSDPLVHLIRNAVDHGIETPDVRTQQGKPEVGNVCLSAAQQGEQIIISIKDDGGGMDAQVLADKAVEKNLISQSEAQRLSPQECYELIFMPGFSTKTEVSDISGRGVGMDVVKNSISDLNGFIEIDSELGRGSEIRVSVPLTLAILPTLMVKVMGRIFAMPVMNIGEVFELNPDAIRTLDGREVVMVRGRALALVYLESWVCQGGVRPTPAEQNHVVVVQSGSQRIALVVDDVQGREEVVIKPLGPLLHELRGLAGATITGDGRIALILDFATLFKDPWAMPREVEA